MTELLPTERSAMNAPLRQGDILLVPVEKVPANLTEVPREAGKIVLAEGEATGHLHAIDSEEATFLAADLAEIEGRFLVVESEVAITHPEHSTVPVAPGAYRVVRPREYAEAGGVSYVAD